MFSDPPRGPAPARLPMVSLPSSLSSTPEVFARVIVEVSGMDSPLVSERVPLLRLMLPLKVLPPARVRLPAPSLFKSPAPPMAPFTVNLVIPFTFQLCVATRLMLWLMVRLWVAVPILIPSVPNPSVVAPLIVTGPEGLRICNPLQRVSAPRRVEFGDVTVESQVAMLDAPGGSPPTQL